MAPLLDAISIYAILRVLISLFLLLLQLAVLPLFLIYSEYRQNICYRIMLAIGLVDICQLLVNGLFIFFGLVHFDYSDGFEKWAGAVNASTWDVLFLLQLLLSMNRLSVVLKNSFLITVKKRELPWERLLFNVLLFLTFLICLGILAVYASPNCGLHFNPTKFYWGYRSNYIWTATVRDLEFKATGFLPLATFVAYCLIIVLLKWRRAPLNKGGKKVANATNNGLLNKQERRILLQSGVQFLLLSLLMLFSYFLPSNATLDMVAFLNIGSIVVCGINPLLYLAMNGQFRDRFLMMFRGQGEHAERMFVVSMAIQTRRESARVRPIDISIIRQSNAVLKRPMTMPPVGTVTNGRAGRALRRGTLFA